MPDLSARPNLDHLRRQAKRLLRDARAGEATALQRFSANLPAARDGLGTAALAQDAFRLHDAQSVVAREHGFRSWTELKRYVEWALSAAAERLSRWLRFVFERQARERALALRMLREEPSLVGGDPWLACVVGDVDRIERALGDDPGFANRPGGPDAMPPLAAVTCSQLIREPAFEQPLLASARLLIDHGADVDGRWTDPRFPDDPLSVLYGAAGRTHHAGMTKLLLDAGADPNDNESLYHSVESRDAACTRLLLAAGARVGGTNAVARALDYDRPESLRMLLADRGEATDRHWLHHAILRGRSASDIRTLVEAGADLTAQDRAGASVYRFASLSGRQDVVALLRERGVTEELTAEDAFVAACASGQEAAARALLEARPDMIPSLGERQLETMPQLAALGRHEAVHIMLSLGWPREVKTAWHATALNLAIFVGDAAMVRLLLEHGADWRTQHGHGDNALGTLSFASRANDVGDPAPRDYAGCAAALVDHGVPASAFAGYGFSPEVADLLDDRSGSQDGAASR
jgi:ankyrin repeat protein